MFDFSKVEDVDCHPAYSGACVLNDRKRAQERIYFESMKLCFEPVFSHLFLHIVANEQSYPAT